MKVRMGFVSNSSSSSFIVVGSENHSIPKIGTAYRRNAGIDIPQTFGGETDFDCTVYTSFPDKLNWAAAMCFLKESPGGYDNTETPWTDMLVEVLSETFDVELEDIKINFCWDDDDMHQTYYNQLNVPLTVNHQCHPSNCDEPLKIFNTKDTLTNWLFSPDSKLTIERD